MSPELSESNSRKTDSGSSLADERQSVFSGLNGQNFSYSNFHSFGGSSPQQSENHPPMLKQQSSMPHQNILRTFEQSQNFLVMQQRSEWAP